MKRAYKIGLAVLCILFSACTDIVAQFRMQKIVRHYSLTHGLSQAVVNGIAQDDQSFLWFATEDGLNRFDGSSFKVFKYGKTLPAVTDNFIQAVYKDQSGTLWASSRMGLIKFDPDTEQFLLYQHPFESTSNASPNDVSFITQGSANNLWIAWYGSGFASFDISSEKFTVYNTQKFPALSSDVAVAALEDKFGYVWIATQNGGLNVFSTRDGKIVDRVASLSNPAELPSANVRAIVQDGRNNIWIGTSRGIVVYVRERNKFVNFNGDASIANKSIFSLLVDAEDNLWIGTQGNGLYRVSLTQSGMRPMEELIFSRVRKLDEFDLSKKTIQSLYQDRDKNLWIGTFGDGIYMVSHEEQSFINFKKLINEEETFTPVSFYGMCYDHDGNLWLGTDGSGLYMRSADGNVETHYRSNGAGSLKDNAVLSALCDSRGRLWFGTYAGGVFLFDKNTKSFIQYRYRGLNSGTAGVNDVRVLFEDSNGNLWVGTNRGGLCLLDVESRTYTTPEGFNGVLLYGDVRCIAASRNGELCLGFYGDGVYRYNTVEKKLTPYFDGLVQDTIKRSVIFSLRFDDHQRLWVGTAGNGVYVHDPAKDSLVHLTEGRGLNNNTIYSILTDRNAAWLSTNSGISRVDLQSFRVTNYDIHDGLQEGQFNPGSGMFNNMAGYMCFGGTLGLNIFYPRQIAEHVESPNVVITGLQIFNRPVSVGDSVDGEPILSKVINKTQEVSLAHDQSVVTFDFIALDFTQPERNHYAYKLQGLDKNWNFVGQQHSATYRYLKPGKYVFKVKSSNRPDTWSDEYTSLTLIIHPPWWKTSWAYLSYLLIFSLLTFFTVKYGRKQLSLRKRLKIEKAQRKHEQRMAVEKLTFFTEISHEFRTPLTLIMGPLEEMLSKEHAGSPNERKLQMVHRNATKLLNLINKLIDYRKIESGNVILKVSENDMVPFVEEIFASFQDLAKTRGISFTFTTEVPSLNAWFDKEKFEMILNNLLSNSFKYLGNGNEISIHVSQQISEKYPQGRAVIRIRDNGIGIPKKHLKNIFDWFYKGHTSGTMNSGIGLSLARKLIHLHKGDIFVESIEGKGSTFSVKIPLGKDHFREGEVDIIRGQPAHEIVGVTSGDPAEVEVEPGRRNENSLLIIEDDEEIRQFLREYFESTYKIAEAADGNRGLDMANTLHPDLIISDIMMPGMDGVELCKALKQNVRTSHIPIILLTAKTSLAHQREGIETGADAYITKPFSPEILSLTVKNLLDSRSKLMRFYRNLFVDAGHDQASAETEQRNSTDEKFLRSVHEQLLLNLDKPDFNVAELADVLHMSRSLIYKKIKMLTGLAPVEYVRSLRMQEAAKLLRTNQYKVFEVVYMVGFSDLKYFRQCFAKEFGVPPSEYMKQSGISSGE